MTDERLVELESLSAKLGAKEVTVAELKQAIILGHRLMKDGTGLSMFHIEKAIQAGLNASGDFVDPNYDD